MRVFLSHTSELRRYPAGRSFVVAAEQAVSGRRGGAGHGVFHRPGQKSRPACREQVGQADVYAGIIGFRYGSPVRDEPSCSYTELEFATAGELGLPRLVFALDEDAVLPLPQRFLSDPVHGGRQRAFRQHVMDAGITVQLVDSPERLEVLLFQALTDLRAESRGSWGAGPGGDGLTRVAVRLAPRPTFLAGREEFLARLDARLAAERAAGRGPGVVVLCGLGGVGKTSVAVEYAYRQAAELGVVWQLPTEDPAGLEAGFGTGRASGRRGRRSGGAGARRAGPPGGLAAGLRQRVGSRGGGRDGASDRWGSGGNHQSVRVLAGRAGAGGSRC